MRVLVTGAQGFVGLHLAAALRRLDSDVELVGTATIAGNDPGYGPVSVLDITDADSVAREVARLQPTHLINLAALAAPAAARANPRVAWNVHVHGAVNLANAILDHAPDCCLVNIGSGLVYGDSAKTGLPMDERTLLAPIDDYSVTKAAGDLALGALAKRGLKCIRFRPFNHIGAGQTEAFVLPAFAMQIARIEAGQAPPVMRVGNLNAERDFLDVEDVVRAYALAIRGSQNIDGGAIFNVASGVPRRIGDVLQQLLALSTVKIQVEQDPTRLNPSDLPRIVGDSSLIKRILGWVPERAFDMTLEVILDDCRSRVRRS